MTEQNNMSNADRELLKALKKDSGGFSINVITTFLWQLKWYIVACVAVSMVVAFFYIKMQTPEYSSEEKVMFLDENTSNSEISMLADLTGGKQHNGIDDEILVIKSPAIMATTIEQLGANYRYYQYRLPLFHTSFPLLRSILNVKESEFYKDSPIKMEVRFPTVVKLHDIVVELKAKDSTTFLVADVTVDGNEQDFDSKAFRYGEWFSSNGITIRITRTEGFHIIEGDEFKAEYCNPLDMGKAFVASLEVALEAGVTSTTTNMIDLKFSDNKPKRAADILNTLIDVYNSQSKQFKSQSAIRSLEFINERLASVTQELGNVETEAKNYQTSTGFILEAGGINPDNMGTYSQQINDLRLQRTILGMLKSEIQKMKPTDYRIIPANIGLEDNGVNTLITAYNEVVTERTKLIMNASEQNPSVLRLSSMAQDARNNVLAAIANLDRVFRARDKELSRLSKASNFERKTIPTRAYDLSKMERRQKIIEPLYVKLNEKKEEIMLSMYSVTDNVRVIESAEANGVPFSPNRKGIYRIAFIIGFLLPVAVVSSRRLLRTKVETKDDITKVLDNPVLATIPYDKEGGGGIISFASGRDNASESFRMLRSSLQYVHGNLIQVTSSKPHEGKSYVAANLAVSLSHTHKRVALVGLDLRKPVLRKLFHGLKNWGDRSVVSYLIGNINQPEQAAIPYKTDEKCFLDIYFAGPIPPNPSELLTMDKMETFLRTLKKSYDYVICDSAPFMPVSDSAILNKYMDYTLYVVRADMTELRMLKEIDNCIAEGKLNNVGIVLNALDLKLSKYRYGYNYGQYGYGYGYGYGYSEETNHKHHHHHSDDDEDVDKE